MSKNIKESKQVLQTNQEKKCSITNAYVNYNMREQIKAIIRYVNVIDRRQ